MSRIGKKSIPVPAEVEIKIKNHLISVRGPKGELSQALPLFLKVEEKNNELKLSVKNPQAKHERALWGTFARLIANMIIGVTKGFEKKLEMVGVGYRAQVSGHKLIFNIGFSHPIEFLIPENIEAKVEKTVVIINGIDKQLVGEVAAQIRRLRKPEPYKGRGIRYAGEIIRRKAGKKVATTTGA